MFEQAVRMKLRFPYKGLCDVEDLWDLKVTELDSIYKVLNAQLKSAKEESLLATRTIADKQLMLQVEIVKHIVEVKVQEAEAKKTAVEKAQTKRRLTEILATKQDAALMEKTPEELQTMIGELG